MLRGKPCSGFEREGSVKKHCWVLPPEFKGQGMKWKNFINTLISVYDYMIYMISERESDRLHQVFPKAEV